MYIAMLLKMLYGEPLQYWFIHMLHFCKTNKCPMITTEELIQYPLHLTPAQEAKYEVRSLPEDTLAKTEMYILPSEFYGAARGMQTKHSIHLFAEQDKAFEHFLDETLRKIGQKHPDRKIQGFLSFGQGYKSLERFAAARKLHVIRTDLSPIRKNDGYTQSLFWATTDAPLYGSKQCEERYSAFLSEAPDFPLFTRQELVALFGKEDTLPLIPLMNARPRYEMGICENKYLIDPVWFVHDYQTSDDIYFESRNFFAPNDIVKRKHPRNYMHSAQLENRQGAESFLLSCKRNVTLASNTMFLSMLWNRTTCAVNNTLAYNFMAERDFTSERIVDLQFLNWMLFAYCVPGYETLFDLSYWQWRYASPSETKIYEKHLDICLVKAGLDRSIFGIPMPERLRCLLQRRGCTEEIIEDILHSVASPEDIRQEEIDYRVAVSKLIVGETAYRCRNRFHGKRIVSSFRVHVTDGEWVRFIPLGDIAGFVEGIVVYTAAHDGAEQKESALALKKQEGFYDREDGCEFMVGYTDDVNIRIEWTYNNLVQGLRRRKVQ